MPFQFHKDQNRFRSRFSDNAHLSFEKANQISDEMNAKYISTEHLLLGILDQEKSRGFRYLNSAGVTYDRVHQVVLATSQKTKLNTENKLIKQLSEAAKLTLKMSWDCAQEFNQDVCGTEHIVLSILEQPKSQATVLLSEMNFDINKIKDDLQDVIRRRGLESSMVQQFIDSRSAKDATELLQDMFKRSKIIKNESSKRSSAIDHFSIDLTARVRKGLVDPIIGRQEQIQRAITILNRRQKNNPVLIGEPGVGKTAIVEGLAQRIVAEEVPDSLLDKKIVILDLASMVAGTKYRGEFEDRFRRLISELSKNKKTVVFIDEIHILVGAGAAEGAIDASNMLKPALARGNLQIIGATTTLEYTKHIEKDAALERRLQPILVPPTTKNETLAILRGLVKHYERHHGVKISDTVLEKTVQLADRYINDRFMPDKAIDLLDEAAAHLRVQSNKTNPKERLLMKKIKQARSEIEKSANNQDYMRAAEAKNRLTELKTQIREIKKATGPVKKPVLTTNHLAEVLSIWTGIPVKQVIRSEAKSLLNLEKKLQKRIIGQPEATVAVASAIRRARSGVSDHRRPIGSFLFLGPTGVGKTELARVLATEFYGRDDALIKIDMSEFGERYTVSRLIGAPPGYVGFDQPGQLTEKVRRQPYSLILFDEIEKAHPDVFNLLLQILEDGVLTDARGRTVNFKSTIIILTSNLGSHKLQQGSSIGFVVDNINAEQKIDDLNNQNKAKIKRAVKKFMKPELINRLDKLIVFRALSQTNIKKIVDLQLGELKQRLLEQKIGLVVSPALKQWLVANGHDKKNGVRSLRRLIQESLENVIADSLLSNEISSPCIIRLKLNRGKIVVEAIADEK